MTNFKIHRITKIGAGIPILRAEYISETEGFRTKEYQKALENYYNNVDEMRVLPIDDFYRIGIEHFHKLDNNHRRMLIELKQKCDSLELKWLPVQIKTATSAITQLFEELGEFEHKSKKVKKRRLFGRA
jgi:hypothetical protein